MNSQRELGLDNPMAYRRTEKTQPEEMHRHDDPRTSELAAKSFDANRVEQIVFEAIKSFGPEGCISDDVVQKLSHMRMSTVTPRFKKLRENGFIINTGEQRVAASGRKQDVMKAIK